MTYNNNNIMQSQQPTISGAMGSAGAMFQPGFAGTNVQEVQHWNQGGHPQSLGTSAPTYGMSFGGGIGGAQSIFSPGFAGTNVQEVRQLNSGYPAQQQQGGYGQNQALGYMQNQSGYIQAQPNYQQANFGAQAGSIFSPGFAGTNVQEVQARNHSGYNNYIGQAGYSNQAGNTPGGSIFSPGFAGTNVQEVRQLNQGGFAPTPVMSSGYNTQAQQVQQQQQYQNQLGMGAQSMFSPGFAGTNAQEVRQLNAPGQMVQQTGSIFPGTF